MVILALVIFTFLYLPVVNAKESDNGAFNIANYSFATSDNDYVYYSKDGKIYKESKNGGKPVVIVDESRTLENLAVYGDYLYYTCFWTYNAIYKVNINGQESPEMVGVGALLTIYDNYLFVYESGKIKKYDLNNFKDSIILKETVGTFTILNNRIYFKNSDNAVGSKGFSSVDLNGNNFKSYLIGNVQRILGEYDGYIYYLNDGFLNRISENTSEEAIVEATNANIYDGYIYFINSETANVNKELFRIPVNGGTPQSCNVTLYPTFCITNGKIYSKTGDWYSIIDLPQVSESYTDNNDDSGTSTTSFGSPVSDWAKPEVEQAYEAGLVPDVLIGEDLTKKVDRAEFAAIAVKLYESLSGKSASKADNPFDDIAGNKCKNEILKAYNLNITVGTSQNKFSPNINITREQVATMLTRAYKKSEFPEWNIVNDGMYPLNFMGVQKFSDDNEISDYAKESVYFMTRWGIIKGVGDNKFAPKNSVTLGESYGYATREQAVVIVWRSKKHL